MKHLLFVLVAGLLWAGGAIADDLPAGALPDAVVARGDGVVRQAWLAEPTERYRHGILGDGIEAGALMVRLDNGRVLGLRLPKSSVFEDREVRLADFNGDGVSEFVVVESSLSQGAALAVYGIREGRIQLIARDDWIGTPNRWLNPAGIADFDGDGELEIAVIVTPHIGGTLKLLRPGGATRMTTVASQWGFSNHAIGSRNQGLSAALDWNGDGVTDLLVPTDSRDEVVAVSFRGGQYRELARYPLGGSIFGNFELRRQESAIPSVHIPLAGGDVVVLRPGG